MKLAVELVGGPLDGHRTVVEMSDPDFDVKLFRREEAGRREVLAYAFQGGRCGLRWALAFLYEVGKQGQPFTDEGKEAAP
jgi:hypothetical protein